MNRLTEHEADRVTSEMPNDSALNNVRLEYDQVFRLIASLESLNLASDHNLDLEQLREDLDDACWLAQWKREYVLMDETKMSIPEVNELLLTCGNEYH